MDSYTIEHILPQNTPLSSDWKNELGSEWERVQSTWLHTLGNLTLTGYNSEYSDRSFEYKRDKVQTKDGKKIGFRFSALNINEGLGETSTWNEDAIQARAERLAKEALSVWPSPKLSSNVLEAYQTAAPTPVQAYSADNFPQFKNSLINILFEALRKEILALDPCVTETYLKLYIAYKAETNFVDIVPQAKRLRLSLNMPFHEIDDPRGMCLDVTDLGRWGNGDVEVGLSGLNDLPYIMGLIRQSFDRQMEGLQDT